MSETSVINAKTAIKSSHMGYTACMRGERVTDGTQTTMNTGAHWYCELHYPFEATGKSG